MSEEKDIFSKIISEKIKDFEVPYNADHWDEMNEQLDNMKPLKEVPPTNRIKRYVWVGAAAVATVAALYFFSTLGDEEISNDNQDNSKIVEELIIEENSAVNEASPQSESEIIPDDAKTAEQNNVQGVAQEEDHGIEHYANLTEDQLKAKSKEDVEEMVKEQISEIPASPVINNSALKTNIVVQDDQLCAGSEIQFGIDREIEDANYYWNFGDKGLTSRKSNPTHAFKKSGTFIVTLIVSKGNIGEKNDYKVEKTIHVEEQPNLKLERENGLITLNYPYSKLTAECNANCNIIWTSNGKTLGEGKECEMLIPDKGYYSVEAVATSNNGCKTTENIEFNASKGVKMEVEDAFSPNDDGINDEFLPKELAISNVEFSFVVRDKNGQVVFTSNDKYNAWNGSLNNSGSALPEDFYFWKVSFTDDRGKVHNQEGRIKLLQR